MSSARQILRYSIPGSVFLLNAAACYMLYQRIQGVRLSDSAALLSQNFDTLIALLAAIPLGFLIYQLYYFTYEPVLRVWPLPWGGRLVRRDRGGQILATLEAEQIETLSRVFGREIQVERAHSVVPSGRGPLRRAMHLTGVLEISGDAKRLPLAGGARQTAYEDLWYTNWDVLRSAVDIAGSSPESAQLKSEYTTLSDIYHSLGAARTAIFSSCVATTLIVAAHTDRLLDQPLRSLAGFVAIAVLGGSLYFVLHQARGKTWRTAAASLSLGLRWYHRRHGATM